MSTPGPRERGQSCPCPEVRTRLPVLRWLPRYSLAWLQLDLIAGLTVGLTVVPQALAYAEVAGLPLQYGLYSSFMGCFVYCFLGTAKDVTLGPTAIMSLLVSSYTFHEPVYAILLAFLSGCIQLAMGLLHLGFLLDFISCPVIKGFTSAASITISFNQIKNILGLQGIPRQFFLQVYETLRRIRETSHPSWGLVSSGQGRDSPKLVKPRSAGAETWRWVREDKVLRMILLLCMPLPKAWKTSAARVPTSCRPSRRPRLQAGFHSRSLCCSTQRPCGPVCWPGCLLLPGDGLPAVHAHRQHPPGPPCLPAAALLHGCTQWHHPLQEHGGVGGGSAAGRPSSLGGNTHRVLPSQDMGVGLAVVPLMGLLETVAIAKAFASQNDYRIDPNQELLAMGFANILGSFVSSYPITGSFGRTAVNAQSGVCTPAGGLVTGTLVLLSLAYLTSLFYYIPKAALAAVIISAVVPLFDAGIFRTLWRVKSEELDLVPLCVTFLLCFWEVQYGIVAGVLVSGILLLYSIARPPIKVSEGNVLLLQPGSSLHFPAIECLRDAVCSHALAASPPRCIILDCRHISSIDYTVVVGLAELLQELRKHGLSLAFCSLQDPVLQVLLSADLEGFQHFPSREEAERCGGADPGGGGAAPFTSTSESLLLPAGLIQ
ncbi:sodium-independent sulfate anion transporter isoform X2 [Aptenodytes patagonicus]|uniref:sodium-independent sulfate anion transporter isoform X2 n=1 Tax=Aptenodytes patagonicus TaxID=9234 RepID=UPI003FA12DCA